MLYLYRRVIFGKLEKEHLRGILDLEPREVAIFAPLVALVFWMGIWPQPFLDVMDASVVNLLQNYQEALATSDATRVAVDATGK
jgi:NADH-quinone oxidoreductase subunit M